MNQASQPSKTQSHKSKLWKIFLYSFTGIVILLSILISLLIYTSLGIHLTRFVLNKALPELKISRLEGTLSNLQLHDLSLNLPGINIQINEASYQLSASCLLTAKACIDSFNANHVSVTIETNKFPPSNSQKEPSSDNKNRFVINMPIDILLAQTHLTNVNVNVDDMTFGLTDFTAKADWRKHQLTIYFANAEALKAIFADPVTNIKKVSTEPKVNLTLNQQIQQLFNQPLLTYLPQISIPLDINVNDFTGNHWRLHIGGEDYYFNQNIIKTNIIDNYIEINQLTSQAKNPYANGDVNINGYIKLGDDWPLQAKVDVKTAKNTLSAIAEGNLLGELSSQLQIHGLNQLNLDGKINFIKKYLPLTIHAKGSHIQWPIEEKPLYQLNDFAINYQGNAEKYQFNSQGKVTADSFPLTSFNLKTVGNNQSAYFSQMAIVLPQGSINGDLKLDWQDEFKWNGNIKLDQVDLQDEIPNYPIKLMGNIKTNGYLKDQDWFINVSKLALNGKIKKADITTDGQISLNNQYQMTANKFKINWGKNHIDIDGNSNKNNLIANLNLASLNLLLDDLKGSLFGQVKMSGDIKDPFIDSHLNIHSLVYKDYSLDDANLNSQIHYNKLISGHLNLDANKINLGALSFEQTKISLTGNESQHALSIDIDGKPISFKNRITAKFDKAKNLWTATIPLAKIIITDTNEWSLTKPLSISYDLNNKVPTINAHCWVNNDASLCLDKTLSVKPNATTSISLKNLALQSLPIVSTQTTKLSGLINSKFDIQFNQANSVPTIKANLNGDHITIETLINDQSLPIVLDQFLIKGAMDPKQVDVNLAMSLAGLGKINSHFLIEDPINKKILSGNFDIRRFDLAFFKPLLAPNDVIDGLIDGSLKFSGSLLDPHITGQIGLPPSEIKTDSLPIAINNVYFKIKFNGKTSDLNGKFTTKSGELKFSGFADWHNLDNWTASMSIKGDPVQFNLPPMIKVYVAPDIKINATNNELDITGKIDLPKGKITVEELPPSIVDVSSDEVMVDKNYQVIRDRKLPMKLNIHIQVNIADKIKVNAFGLEANLKGNLQVLQDNKGLSLTGQIVIPKGRFHAYGQDLIIRKGDLIFTGPPDQPRLDIEAIRNPEAIEDNVTAGIRVSGLADNPKIEIFSDPAMSQQEALSYLLRGQGLENSEQGENDMMTALLIGLGTAKGGQYVGDLGNLVGIKNLSLDTLGAGNSSKVVVSGYILPDLQVKYGVGIFDSIATFTLRYRLMPKLYLDATTGISETIDLIYQFNF